jgi:ribosomal protein L11 methyltransferase
MLDAAQVSTTWRTMARVRGTNAASAVFAVLDDLAAAVSSFEAGSEEWRLEAYPQSPLLTAELRARLALAAAAAGGTLVGVNEERLAARDWLAENQLSFPPLWVGRFFIYGSHYPGNVPAGMTGIAVDAAIAFGTGEHPSTRACLMALDRLARRRRFRRPLDVGTGTGILAIAAAKLLHSNVLGTDIDPDAVGIARQNVARNGVKRLVQIRKARGYRDRAMRKSRYDLILSNILARPLAEMARDLAQSLAPGGRAVLSGLLPRQEPIVLVPHRGCGIVLDERLVIDGWSTLVMHRRADMKMGAEAPIFESRPVERQVRPPLAGRAFSGSERESAVETEGTRGDPLRGRRFANGAVRYRRASDHRGPSARHRPGPAAATRRRPFPPK